MKKHLADDFANILVCSKTSPTIIKDMKDYIQKYIEKSAKKNYVLQLDDKGYDEENHPTKNNSTGASNTVPSHKTLSKRKAVFNLLCNNQNLQ